LSISFFEQKNSADKARVQFPDTEVIILSFALTLIVLHHVYAFEPTGVVGWSGFNSC